MTQERLDRCLDPDNTKVVKRLGKINKIMAPHIAQNPDILTATLLYLAVERGLDLHDVCDDMEKATTYFASDKGQEWFERLSKTRRYRKKSASEALLPSQTDVSSLFAQAIDDNLVPAMSYPTNFTAPVPMYGPQVGLQAFLNDVMRH